MNRWRYLILGAVALLVPFLLMQENREVKAAQRIRSAYQAAELPVLRTGSGLPEVEQFAADLRAISLEGAPQDVRDAMTTMIAVVEDNANVRRESGDTNAANERVVTAKRDLWKALARWRGEAF